jgi:sulfur relay (sulfurtransferase) DsrF/TusC family protein
MIDFNKFIGKNAVLVTNYTNTPDELFGIRNELSTIELFTINNRYICVRTLNESDLKDDDFVQWLNTMWSDETELITFLKSIKKCPQSIRKKK